MWIDDLIAETAPKINESHHVPESRRGRLGRRSASHGIVGNKPMSNYAQHFANAIAVATRDAIGGAPATVIKPSRPRSVSEILDIAETFVCGYPQRVEEPSRRETN
jgi:hypothetical protein